MKGTITAFIAVALFGLYSIFGKILLQQVSPVVIMVLNQGLAGIILLLLLDVFRKLKKFREVSRHDVFMIALVSLFGSVAAPLLFLLGLKLTTATSAVLVAKSEAVLTSLFAVVMLNERVSRNQLGGALLMLLGVAAISTNNFATGFVFHRGDLLIVAASIMYAIGTILFKKNLRHVPPEIIVTLRNLFGATILFVFSFFFVDYSNILSVASPKFVFALLGLVTLATIIGQFLWYKALEITTASKVSFAGLASPLFAIVYAIAFLGESLQISQIVGGLLIMSGLVILELHWKKKPKKKHSRHLHLRHWPHP